MRNMIFAVATAAATFCTIGAVSLWGPAGPARAESVSVQNVSLLPQVVVEEAIAEGQTPSAPLPDILNLRAAPASPFKAPTVADPKATRRAGSLSELVSFHGSTQTPDREAECLAVAVYFESKGEPLLGQLGVAETVINRTRSGRFPSSICGVVLQKSQFSFVRGGGFPAIARNSQNWKTAVAIGHIARNNLWNSQVSNALFFHARRVAPGWNLRQVGTVGNHVFYR
jgi:N-acetylmuramoyl-L-alanine amidase